MLNRLLVAVFFFVAFFWFATSTLHPWYNRWGATDEEVRLPLPGDELLPGPAHQSTLAVTVQAAPEAIWPWLVQLGAGRGGLYSYSWFERLLNCPVHNADRVIPELQHPQAGDEVRMCPGEFGPPPFTIAAIQPGVAFIYGSRDDTGAAWASTYQLVLLPQDAHTTRLVFRTRSASLSSFDKILGPGYFLMERRKLQGIRERTEGAARPEWTGEIEILLWLAAFTGFLVAEVRLVFRRDGRPAAFLAGFAALLTLLLAFLQPPWWIDVLGVAAIYSGLVWTPRRKDTI
jgi:hypothetical protein